MEMNIGLLKQMIAESELPDDAPVFVACNGICNYDFKHDEPFGNTDTFAFAHEGKLFLTDEYAVLDENGDEIL